MREFTRIILRVFMCLFLVVGCVQNVYYFGEIADSNDYARYNRKHKKQSPIVYDENGYNEYQQPSEEVEDTVHVDLTEDDNIYSRPSYYY